MTPIPRSSAFLVSLGLVCPGIAMAQVPVDFSPSSVNVQVGESVLVEISVTNVPQPGLAAFQFDLTFDPLGIDILNPNEAFRGSVPPFAPLGNNALCTTVRGTAMCEDPDWFLITTGRTPFGVDTIDNVSGLVQVAYGTSGGQALPAGSGAIALIEVVGESGGTFIVNLSSVILADNQEPPMTFSTTPGALTVIVANRPPILAPIGGQLVEGGAVLMEPVSSSDPDGDNLTLTAMSLPSFCALVDNGDGSGSLDCTPAFSDVGVYPVSVMTTDDGSPNLADSENFDITVITASTCTDGDNDGYGSPGHLSCPAGDLADCDDTDPDVNPAATEICRNTLDDDCNGLIDDDAFNKRIIVQRHE